LTGGLGAGLIPAVPPIYGNASDASKKQLLNPIEAAKIRPEIDHIVPKKEGGSNDERNARVLSQRENISPTTVRPGVGIAKRQMITTDVKTWQAANYQYLIILLEQLPTDFWHPFYWQKYPY